MLQGIRLSARPHGPTPGSDADPRSHSASEVSGVGFGLNVKEQPSRLDFMTLPTEIHLAISEMLIYPDALSLKHTNRHLYNLVDTGVNLKVQWLVERRSLHLECPNDRRCDLGSDLRFCRGSVPLLMQRRREHVECESKPGLGCLVFGTDTCSHRPKGSSIWRRWLKAKMTVELWWVLVALVPILLCWTWMIEMIWMQ